VSGAVTSKESDLIQRGNLFPYRERERLFTDSLQKGNTFSATKLTNVATSHILGISQKQLSWPLQIRKKGKERKNKSVVFI